MNTLLINTQNLYRQFKLYFTTEIHAHEFVIAVEGEKARLAKIQDPSVLPKRRMSERIIKQRQLTGPPEPEKEDVDSFFVTKEWPQKVYRPF